jgi:hypothetical protein
MLYRAFLQIRMMGWAGKAEQAAELADLFHNLPQEMWRDYFSVSFLRRSLLEYQSRHSCGVQTFLNLLDEVDRLKS